MEHFKSLSTMLVTIFCSLILFGCTSSSPVLVVTSVVKENGTEAAKTASAVNSSYFFNIKSYSGFLDVEHNANLFFWYFPATDIDAPWVLWLQSDVGLTSLVGLFTTNGPFYHFQNDSNFATVDSLKERKYSWTKNFSMVFLDNCAGTGYSFKVGPVNEEMHSAQLLNAVQQLVQIYPELSRAPLYLAGEGFAGHFIPNLALAIHNAKNQKGSINLKGLILGNPILNADSIEDYISVFLNFGLIDKQGALAAQTLQDAYLEELQKDRTTSNAYLLREDLLYYLKKQSGKSQIYNALKDYNDNDFNYTFYDFLRIDEIMEALHAGNISAVLIENYSSRTCMKENFLANVTEKIVKLLEHYRILIYWYVYVRRPLQLGQLSLSTPCLPIADHIRNTWYWSQRNVFLHNPRLPWWLNEKIAGYIKSGGNLTEVLITNTGDLISVEKPEELLYVVTNFINNFQNEFLYPSSNITKDTATIAYVETKKFERRIYHTTLTISVIFNVILMSILIAFGIFLLSYTWKLKRTVHQATINIRL